MIDADHFRPTTAPRPPGRRPETTGRHCVCITDTVKRAGDCAAHGGNLPCCCRMRRGRRVQVAERSAQGHAMVGRADRRHSQHRHRQHITGAFDGIAATGGAGSRSIAASNVGAGHVPKLSLMASSRHFSRCFFISARRPSRRSARAMPKAMLARRKPGFEPQSCRSPSNSTP